MQEEIQENIMENPLPPPPSALPQKVMMSLEIASVINEDGQIGMAFRFKWKENEESKKEKKLYFRAALPAVTSVQAASFKALIAGLQVAHLNQWHPERYDIWVLVSPEDKFLYEKMNAEQFSQVEDMNLTRVHGKAFSLIKQFKTRCYYRPKYCLRQVYAYAASSAGTTYQERNDLHLPHIPGLTNSFVIDMDLVLQHCITPEKTEEFVENFCRFGLHNTRFILETLLLKKRPEFYRQVTDNVVGRLMKALDSRMLCRISTYEPDPHQRPYSWQAVELELCDTPEYHICHTCLLAAL